jgi:hypothetical protein
METLLPSEAMNVAPPIDGADEPACSNNNVDVVSSSFGATPGRAF